MKRFGTQFALVALATTALSPITVAVAQDTPEAAEEERRFGPIQVTAQRREQSLLDVPVSVSAFDGELLEDLGVDDLTEVGKISPNVTLEVSRGTNTTLSAFIRGVGQQDPVAGFESGVGIYLDDVYLNRPQGAVLDVFDVERIEVLRGPQGTLYGRNTIGGAVKYVTRGLSDTPEFKGRAALGSYNQRDLVLTASMPLAETFRVGGSFAMLTRDGFGENLNLGGDNYDKDITAGRVSAEWDVTPDFSVRAMADYLVDRSSARNGHRLIPGQLSGAPVLNNVFDTRAGLDVVDQDADGGGISVVADWTINDAFSLKSVTAYREDSSTTPIDFDSLPGADLDVPAIYKNDQVSQEFLLNYSGDRLNGVAGVYYLDANASTVFDVILSNILPDLNAQTFGDVSTQTWAVFGDFTYDVTPELSVTVGARYTEDERQAQVLRRTFIGFSEFFGGTPILLATTSDFNGTETFDDFSPRVSVQYDLSDNSNIYATYAQGFKGGGFDPRGQTSAAPDFDQNGTVTADEVFEFMQFDPEEVNSYEVGYKASQLDGRLNYSVAAFYSDYKDVQIPGSVGVDTDGDGVNDTFTGVTTNAGAATIWGIEFEGNADLGQDVFRTDDFLNASWSLGYLDAQYDEFIDATGTDVSNQREVQNTPDWTASARLAYGTPVQFADVDGSILANVLVSYRGDSTQFEIPEPIVDQDAFTTIDASIRWEPDNGNWGLFLNGKNLTDEEIIVAAYDFVNVNANGTFTPTLGSEGTLTGFYADPRTFTFGVDFEF